MATVPNPPQSLNSGKVLAGAAVTPSDSTDLPDGVCIGLNVQVAGNVSIVDPYGNTVTYYMVEGGNPYAAKRVRSTGTTATGITACY